MTQTAMITALKNKLSSVVPAAIVTAELTAFDDFLDVPPNDDDRRQACVYLAQGDNNISLSSESFILHFQLANETRPDKYLSVLWPLILAIDPNIVGMLAIDDVSHSTWYPGEAGSTSFVFIEIRFSSELDDSFLDS